jgi:hypothetical protein
MTQLKSLDLISQNVQKMDGKDVFIPIDVVRFVDDGKNPDIYMNEMYTLVNVENKKIKRNIEKIRVTKFIVFEFRN